MLHSANTSLVFGMSGNFPLDIVAGSRVQSAVMTFKCISTQAPFGELIRRWRGQRGMSQGDFGKLLDPHARRSTVCCWEKGSRRPSFKFLGQILIITGIPAHFALAPTFHGARQEQSQP